MDKQIVPSTDRRDDHQRPGYTPHPSFWQATRFWIKLGLISFGGPAGQISIMHHELVEQTGPELHLRRLWCYPLGGLDFRWAEGRHHGHRGNSRD
jgi:hypothetical protein